MLFNGLSGGGGGGDYQMFSRCHPMARARDYDDSPRIIRLKWDEGGFDFTT